VDLVIKNAADGRILYQGSVSVAFVDFDVNLSSLTLQTPTEEEKAFTPPANEQNLRERLEFSHNGFPSPVAAITAVPANSRAVISGDIGEVPLPLFGEGTSNTKTITVTAPHGAASKTYTLHINRNEASNKCDIESFRLQSWPDATADFSATGRIEGTNITYYAPYGTNLASAVTPSTSCSSGAVWDRITPGSGYESPVQFRVTAEDRTAVKNYTVNVSAAALSSITSITGQTTLYAVNATPSLSGAIIKGSDAAGYTNLTILASDCEITSYNFSSEGTNKPVKFRHKTYTGVEFTYNVKVAVPKTK
jgi:hypothetical protein